MNRRPTLLLAFAMATRRLGVIATASTTFEPVYTIVRRFASLDPISEGRTGWDELAIS
jgi:alkanesulfonate monooxygenase SsuD/methylene tetrahydromethanopterin reductase-like flavin-dependent oxidoreductase (luciferase family)